MIKNFKWGEIVQNELEITKNSAMYLIPLGIGGFKIIVVDDEGNRRALQSTGLNGKSAYEIAVEEGYDGTEVQWLESLKGANGLSGKSAYQIALDNGFVGTETEWLNSIKGQPGTNGIDGISAYEIAVENGFEGSEIEWLDSLEGAPGQTHQMFLEVENINLNAYLEVKLIEGNESISEKDLYIVFQRFITKDSTSNTIFQIGEKIGSSVGVNENLVSSYVGPIDANADGIIYFETVPENNSGAKFSIIIDVNKLITGVDTDVNLNDRIRLNSVYFSSEAKRSPEFPIFSKVKNSINQDFLIDIKARNSSIEDFKNADGSWKELFLTFMRFKDFDNTSTSIVTITQKVGSSIEFGVNDLSTNSLDLSPDTNGIISITLLPLNNSNIYLDLLIDVNKLRSEVDTQTVFTDQIQLNTQYLVNQIKPKTTTRKLVCFGDSVTEFTNYPELVGRKLGLKAYNVGIGGTTLGKNNSIYYTAINFPNLAQAIVSNNWTAVDAAVQYIKDNESDDNTAIITRLKSIDFTKITDITVFYGTNDFTGDNNIGSIDLTNEDILTTSGGLNKGIKTLLNAFPQLIIHIITPYHRFLDSGLTQDSDTTTNTLGKYLIEYVDAIKSMSALNHLPCFDFYRNGQFNKYNHSIYFDDAVHQNDLGNIIITEEISKFIKR